MMSRFKTLMLAICCLSLLPLGAGCIGRPDKPTPNMSAADKTLGESEDGTITLDDNGVELPKNDGAFPIN